MRIHTVTKTIRIPESLNEDLIQLSLKVQRHSSTIIRDSISKFVKYYLQNPKELSV